MKEKLLDLVLGSLLSSTMWFGSLVAFAQWLQNNSDIIINLFGGQYHEIVGYVLAIVIWLLRLKTTEPLVEKSKLVKPRK